MADVIQVDVRDALSSLNMSSANRSYFFVDLRSAEEEAGGILATGVMASGRSWKSPVLVEGIVNCLKELKKNVAPFVPFHVVHHRNYSGRESNETTGRSGRSSRLSFVFLVSPLNS